MDDILSLSAIWVVSTLIVGGDMKILTPNIEFVWTFYT